MHKIIQRWHDAFADPAGGFYERLDTGLKPIDLPKRLLTQCRQIFVYGSEGMDMKGAWDFTKKNYHVPQSGGWRFSQNENHYDLYVHGFALLACATMKDFDTARETLSFIKRHFARDVGFAYTLDERLKQQPGPLAQNPHMHLFEGCLAMFEASGEAVYADAATDILKVWFDKFFDGVVHEYHDGDKASLIEGGHQSEWVWLLTRYRDVLDIDDARINPAITSLWNWVHQYGLDKTYGGILNAQTKDGVILDDKKRIWPVCETLRAARIMGDARMEESMRALLDAHYLRPDGFWNEVLNRDLSPATGYLPGTTPYHLYAVIGNVAARSASR